MMILVYAESSLISGTSGPSRKVRQIHITMAVDNGIAVFCEAVRGGEREDVESTDAPYCKRYSSIPLSVDHCEGKLDHWLDPRRHDLTTTVISLPYAPRRYCNGTHEMRPQGSAAAETDWRCGPLHKRDQDQICSTGGIFGRSSAEPAANHGQSVTDRAQILGADSLLLQLFPRLRSERV